MEATQENDTPFDKASATLSLVPGPIRTGDNSADWDGSPKGISPYDITLNRLKRISVLNMVSYFATSRPPRNVNFM